MQQKQRRVRALFAFECVCVWWTGKFTSVLPVLLQATTKHKLYQVFSTWKSIVMYTDRKKNREREQKPQRALLCFTYVNYLSIQPEYWTHQPETEREIALLRVNEWMNKFERRQMVWWMLRAVCCAIYLDKLHPKRNWMRFYLLMLILTYFV